jgi:hypothetical protein
MDTLTVAPGVRCESGRIGSAANSETMDKRTSREARGVAFMRAG